MQSIVPSFAQLPAGNSINVYPGQQDEEITKPVLCCGSPPPFLSYSPPVKLSFPHEGLIQALIKDLMREKRNSDKQEQLALQNSGISLPTPPYIPPRFTYVVEVTTRLSHKQKVKITQQNGNFVEREVIGFPDMILSSHKPYRWFVLSDEDAFHVSQVQRVLTEVSDHCLAKLALSRFKYPSGGHLNQSSGAPHLTMQIMSWSPVTKTYVPYNEIQNEPKKKYGFASDILNRPGKKHELNEVMESSNFTPEDTYECSAPKKQKLGYGSTVLQVDMEARTWVEISQDDFSELFDNTERESMGGLVQKYRCGRVGCLAGQEIEWSFQVLEPVVVHEPQGVIPTHKRDYRAASTDRYSNDDTLKVGRPSAALRMRQCQRNDGDVVEDFQLKSESGQESNNDDTSDGSPEKGSFKLHDTTDEAFEVENDDESEASEGSGGEYDSGW